MRFRGERDSFLPITQIRDICYHLRNEFVQSKTFN